MRLERVLQMPAHEVFVRGRQKAFKWLDQMAADEHALTLQDRRRGGAGVPGRTAHDGRQHIGAAPVGRFRDRIRGHFFEGAAYADTTAALIARMPGFREQIISRADVICRGRFDLLGYRGLDFGDPVDWHLDPVSGRRVPLVHWARLDPLDSAVVGDSKVVWELNRHQWLLHLGQAYRFTRDERYAETFARYMQEWLRANPVGMGINWGSSLEVAFRMISWCWGLALFEGSPALSADLFAEMLAGIDAHARHVERYLSLYFSPNTHLTGEALGLFYAGVLFPELHRAPRWETLGARILIAQSERQILPDGVYFEQSTCYQRYTAEIYLHFLILARRNEIGVPDTVAQRVQRLLDFLVAVRRPDGTMPQIGDADSGWLLPLVPRAADDPRGVFALAAAFFSRSDYAWAGAGLAPEVPWLLGSMGAKTFEALMPTPPQAAPSRLFPDGGYAVMRSGWEYDAHQLLFDVGPLGCPVSGGHGHADLLSIQCSIFGIPYLVDPGTYCYAVEPQWRDFFRSTGAHNALRVDGMEQAAPDGPFVWRSRPRARLRQWLCTHELELADAEHTAYGRLSDPVRHRRRVVFIKPRYWIIIDDLEGAAEHQIDVRFHFAPHVAVNLDDELAVRARGSNGSGMLVQPFSKVPLHRALHRGTDRPIAGWVSADYGRRETAPMLSLSAVARLPIRIVTLLYPLGEASRREPVASPLIDPTGEIVGLGLGAQAERICFGGDGVTLTRSSSLLPR